MTKVPGYPIGNRSAAQRQKAEDSILGDVEWAAGRIVARLTGEKVVLQDDNSFDGMPDFRIEYTDHPFGFGEVVTDIDESYAQMTSILRQKGGGLPRELAAGQHDRVWYLTLSGRANLARLDRELPALLGELEKTTEVFKTVTRVHEIADGGSEPLRHLDRLGVVEVSSRPAAMTETGREPGRILLYPAGAHGPAEIDWTSFIDWLTNSF